METERSDPVRTTLGKSVDLLLEDHPAIPDSHEGLDPELGAYSVDLPEQRRGVARVPGKDGHAHWATEGICDEPVVHLHRVLLAIATVTPTRQ